MTTECTSMLVDMTTECTSILVDCALIAFLMCLLPLCLTPPNCLRELMWALYIRAADKMKKLSVVCVPPVHPSVSFAGC